MRARLFLGALLVASVALNAWLLLRKPAPAPGAAPAAAVPASPLRARPPPAPHASATADSPLGAATASTPTAALAPRTLEKAQARIADLEQQVRALGAELRKRLPADERWKSGAPDPGSADRLKPEVARVLDSFGFKYDLDCRDLVCRVLVHVPEGSSFDGAVQAVQHDKAIRKLIYGWALHASEPWNDPATGEAYTNEPMYAVMNDPSAADGAALVKGIVDTFKSSSSLADCTGNYASQGTFEATVEVSDEGLQIATGGTLAPTRAGECLAERLRQTANAVAIPQPVTEAMMGFQMVSPPR